MGRTKRNGIKAQSPPESGRAVTKTKKGNGKVGRPSKGKEKWNPNIIEQAQLICAEEGVTDVELAKEFGVSIQTIDLWKRRYPEFKVALREGKDDFDTVRVEGSLLKRAMGYSYEEVKTETMTDLRGNLIKALKVTKTLKQLAPDTTAQIFWLKNRNRARWKDYKAMEMSGPDGKPIVPQQVNIYLPDNFREKEPKAIDIGSPNPA